MNLPSAKPRDTDSHFTPGRLALLMAVLITISYPDVVFGTHAFFYRDAGLFGYPVASYFRHCFWQGQWPLWNPYSNCGIPFLAQWNTLTLYPFSLFYLLLPMPWSLNYFMLGHIFLGALGMYFLARRWWGNRFAASIAGLAFGWNGLSINFLMWPCHIAALGWMPWVVLACELAVAQGGRAILWASLAGACQMLTGSPEMILFTWLIVVIFGIARPGQNFWHTGRRLAAVVILVTGLSAAQLVPWFDLVIHGDRSAGFDNGMWSLPAWGIANFLVPLFRMERSLEGVFSQGDQQWTSSYYVGIVTLALALVALFRARERRIVLLGVMAAGSVLLACGDAGFVLPLLKKIVPLLGFARYPVKFLIIAIFCLPLLAAAGMTWLQAQPKNASERSLAFAAGLLLIGSAIVLLAVWKFPSPGENQNVEWQSAVTRLLFLGGAVAILYWQRIMGWRPLLSFGLLLLIGIDICTHVPRQNPTVPVQAYDKFPLPMNPPPQLGQSRAMLSRAMAARMDHLAHPVPLQLYLGQRAELFSDCNLLDLVPKVDGFFSLHLRPQREVAVLLYGSNYLPKLAQFLGVSQLTSSQDLFKWEPQTNFMPMASIGQKPLLLDDAATLTSLGSDKFQPRDEVYLPLASPTDGAERDADAHILSSAVEPSSCQFETTAVHPTMLVVAQTYYHCWKAEVDGHATPLLRANHAFQAVVVPPGRHVVRLVYRDTAFKWAAIISFLFLVFCVMGSVRRFRGLSAPLSVN